MSDNGLLSVAVIIPIGVNTDSRHEVLGLEIGTSEAERIWTEFLRKLTRRGLRGVKPVTSDAHEGIKAAVSKVLCAKWQLCRVHFQSNIAAHARKCGRRVVSASLPKDDAIVVPGACAAPPGPRSPCTVGALLLEQNDEWAVQRARYMTLETIAPMGKDIVIRLPAVASRSSRPVPSITVTIGASYTTLRDTICTPAP
jgi:hypothetical protein